MLEKQALQIIRRLLIVACAIGGTAAPAQRVFLSGTPDTFAPPTEAPSPSPGILAFINANYPGMKGVRQYDELHANQYFGTTFTGVPSVCGAKLELQVQLGDSPLNINDGISLAFLGASGTPVASGWDAGLGDLGLTTQTPQTLILDLEALPSASGPVNLLPSLNHQHFLDVLIQDDTGVDYAKLTVTPCDVWMKDNLGDTGKEPSTGIVYESPDIRVCHSLGCTGYENPIRGQTNYVYATLRNNGPNAPVPHQASGTIELYYTSSGGAAVWTKDWTLIGKTLVTLAPNEVRDVWIPWVPPTTGPSHVCLLARWVSEVDPMTYTETTNTLDNTQKNNNLAWRNVNLVNAPSGLAQYLDFRVRNIDPKLTTMGGLQLRIPEPSWSFLRYGRIYITLSPALWNAWVKVAGSSTGVRVVGDRQLQVINPNGAWLPNIQLAPDAAEVATLSFIYDGTQDLPPFKVEMVQFNQPNGEQPPIELGGVEYDIRASRSSSPAP